MTEIQIKNNNSPSDEISLNEIIKSINEWWAYLNTQRIKIAVWGFIGGCIGFIYAWKQPVTYTAKLTFVVEDGKSSGSGLGGLASIAGQFGLDVGGSSGNGGVLSGDNILLYFKSESLAREVLLSKYENNADKSVADVYADVYKLKESWEKNKNIGKIRFTDLNSNTKYSRLHDSLLQQIIRSINNNHFTIAKTDKKASFIDVIVNMEDESLAKIYCERIVKVATNQYLKLKTERQKITVEKLQARVDSIANLLGQKTVVGATLQTSALTLDINPLYKTETAVAVETTVRDKTLLATIFAAVVQNLEMAKFTLSQETPVIQIVDFSYLPLPKYGKSKLLFSMFGFISFIVFLVIYLTIKQLLNRIIRPR